MIDTPRQRRLLTANGQVAACCSRGHDTDPDINSTFSDSLPSLSIPNVTMSSIIKNVVHWGSHSQRQKTPVPVDLCEVFYFFKNFSSMCVLIFMKRSAAKSQNMSTKASSTHIAVGAAHGTGRDLVQPLVYFVDVVQQASLHLPISVPKHMLGI